MARSAVVDLISNPNNVHFVYRDGFNYQTYIEQQTHFDSVSDQVSYAIDRQTALLATGNERISEELLRAGQQQSEATQAGAEQVSNAISESASVVAAQIRASSGEISSTITYYGEATIDKLNEMNDRLAGELAGIGNKIEYGNKISKGILEATLSPEKTWAEERFRKAQQCFERNLLVEALGLVDQAIGGSNDRLGDEIDPRYHLLRGEITFPTSSSVSENIANIFSSQASFKLAVRYSRHDGGSGIFFLARKRLGIVSYMLGEFGESVAYLTECLEIYQDDVECRVYRAKAFSQRNVLDNFQDDVEEIVFLDARLILRFSSDPDFFKNRPELHAGIQRAIHRLLVKLETARGRLQTTLSLSRTIIEQFQLGCKPPRTAIDYLEKDIPTEALKLRKEVENIPNAFKKTKEDMELIFHKLDELSIKLNKSIEDKRKKILKDRHVIELSSKKAMEEAGRALVNEGEIRKRVVNVSDPVPIFFAAAPVLYIWFFSDYHDFIKIVLSLISVVVGFSIGLFVYDLVRPIFSHIIRANVEKDRALRLRMAEKKVEMEFDEFKRNSEELERDVGKLQFELDQLAPSYAKLREEVARTLTWIE